MTSLFHSLGNIIRVNVLPALERCALAASQLRGLARYYEGSKSFDVPAECFTKVIVTVDCVQLIVQEAVQILGQEERQFRAFSKWLRHQIDLAAAEPGSQSALELAEREASNLEVGKVLSYLEGPLFNSRVALLISPEPASKATGHGFDYIAQLIQLDVAEALNYIRSTPAPPSDTLKLSAWIARLETDIRAACLQIRSWQHSTWTSPLGIKLPKVSVKEVCDMRMFANSGSPGDTRVLLFAVPADDPSQLIQLDVEIETRKGSRSEDGIFVNERLLHFNGPYEISDVKITKDRSILILLMEGDDRRLLQIATSTLGHDDRQRLQISPGEVAKMTIETFSKTEGFMPAKIAINETNDRESLLLLDEKGQHWKIYRMARRGMSARGVETSMQEDIDESTSMMMD